MPFDTRRILVTSFIIEILHTQTKTDTEAKEDDKPPPRKPERVTKTKNKPPKQPSDTKYYEEMDDI